MTAIRPDPTQYSFVVFPFLKTRGPVTIGNLTFRSTEDKGQLAERDSEHLRDIAEMLFLKDDFRIHSASYVAVPYIDLEKTDRRQFEQLERVQAFVAYAYGSPHEIFGDPFLSSEHASLVIFSPSPVFADLVMPDYHVDLVGSKSQFVPDQRHEIPGYIGLFNFRHYFWAAKGSRLYGPKPHITLNISQDLIDLGQRATRRDIKLLAKAIAEPPTETSERIITAIRWFNAANAAGSDEATAIVSLSIAFETMLALPDKEKITERLTDAVALILGRIPRLDIWARQFYNARSEIVHEGRTRQLRFIASNSKKPDPNASQCQSLISYGRQIFQLCVGVLLTGADLAKKAVLEDKLITNQERFEFICKILSNPSSNTVEKLSQVIPQVMMLDRFRFVSETGLRIETMLGATRLLASTLLESDLSLNVELRGYLGRFASAKITADHYDELDALRSVHELVGTLNKTSQASEDRWATFSLIDVVWHYTFMHYFWIREQHRT
jgi:hypothetical protein